MSDILRIVVVLLVMIAIISRKIDLVYALAAGILTTALLFHHLPGLLPDAWATITDPEVLDLFLVFIFVFGMSALLTDAGILKTMLSSLEKLVGDVKVVIISLPFLIGLVPAPSGAMLSAPFVEEVGNKIHLKPERKLLINYWFRHITEYLNPIYPGPILLVTLLGITFRDLFFLNLPIVVFVFVLGFLVFVRTLKNGDANHEKPTPRDLRIVLNAIWPIVVAILLPVLFKIDIAVSLLLSILLIILVNKIPFRLILSSAKQSVKINMLLLVFFVMLFKTVLDNSHAIERVSAAFIQNGFPTLFLIVVIPLIIGALTGFTLAVVGVGYPLLMPILRASGELNMSLVMLAYVSGYMGIMISPAHLCFSVTQKYFNASYDKLYRQLIPPIIIVFVFALSLALLGWRGM